MKHRVEVTRSGQWWAIEFLDDDRIHSQARRLDQVPAMAADALSLAYDGTGGEPRIDVSPDDIEIVAVHLHELDEIYAEVLEVRDRAAELQEQAAIELRLFAKRSLDEGLTVRDVGELLGVSYQRAAVLAREGRGLQDA